MHSRELREALSALKPDDTAELLVRLYKKYPQVRGEVEGYLDEYPRQEEQWTGLLKLFDGIGQESSPAQCREALSSYLLVCRDKRKAVRAFFAFADKALSSYEEGRANESVLGAAASAFGRGLSYLEGDALLWADMNEAATSLADRFYAYNDDFAWRALRRYQEAKRAVENKTDPE